MRTTLCCRSSHHACHTRYLARDCHWSLHCINSVRFGKQTKPREALPLAGLSSSSSNAFDLCKSGWPQNGAASSSYHCEQTKRQLRVVAIISSSLPVAQKHSKMRNNTSTGSKSFIANKTLFNWKRVPLSVSCPVVAIRPPDDAQWFAFVCAN